MPQIGAIGTTLRLTVVDENDAAISLVGATVKELVITKADGTQVTQTAAFTTDGTDGQIEWVTTAADDFDQEGKWGFHGNLAAPAFSGTTTRVPFVVSA